METTNVHHPPGDMATEEGGLIEPVKHGGILRWPDWEKNQPGEPTCISAGGEKISRAGGGGGAILTAPCVNPAFPAERWGIRGRGGG